MRLRTQVIIILFLLVVLAVIISMVRKRQLELKYVLVWLACDVALIFLTLFPELMGSIAKILGIHSPMNMIFFLGLVVCLVIIFTLTVALSRVTAKVRRISQVLAMLTEKLQDEIKEEVEKELHKET